DNPSDAEDSGLGRIENRSENVHTMRAEVGDRRRPSQNVFGFQPSGRGPAAKLAYLRYEVREWAPVSCLDYRHDKTALDRHSEADVNLLEYQDGVTIDDGVQRGTLAERDRQESDEERVIGHGGAELKAQLRACGDQLFCASV